jgi:hypothetical protein
MPKKQAATPCVVRLVALRVSPLPHGFSVRRCARRRVVSGRIWSPSIPRRCAQGRWLGARIHRDANGSATICSKAARGCYSKVQADTVKDLRPLGVAPRTRATSR